MRLGVLIVAACSAVASAQMQLRPTLADVNLGKSLAAKKRKPDQLFGKARASVGKWFNGSSFVSTEYVIRPDQAFLSRWLGYWSVRDGWTPESQQERWSRAFRGQMGETRFLICLSSYPKMDTAEIIEPAPPNPEQMEIQSISVMSGGKAISGTLRTLDTWRVRERRTLDSRGWWQDWTWFQPLVPNSFQPGKPPIYDLGDYFARWYEFVVPETIAGPCELQIVSPGKVRLAKFR